LQQTAFHRFNSKFFDAVRGRAPLSCSTIEPRRRCRSSVLLPVAGGISETMDAFQ